MTPERLARLSKDMDALHAKHIAHPAVILIQHQDERKIYSLMVGSPSREWLCHVIDNELAMVAAESFLLPPVKN